MIIKGEPDGYSYGGESFNVLGPKWLQTSATYWEAAFKEPARQDISINLSDINFVSLFDWVHVVSLAESLLAKKSIGQLDLDILGKTDLRLMDPSSYLSLRRGQYPAKLFTQSEAKFSDTRYRLGGFLESLGTYSVLNRPQRSAKVMYPGLTQEIAALRSVYAAKPGEKPHVMLGLQRIAAEEDCLLFLDDSQIRNWRQEMDTRFRTSPLFESDEVWRVLCHELATNIWEHSGSAGFIAARVVESAVNSRNELLPWCRWTYPAYLHSLLGKFKGPFLELCVSDAGTGFMSTLSEACSKALKLAGSIPSPAEVLSFAFDEVGTCKSGNERWATVRHALCRVLRLIVKYGGSLRLRSDNAEIAYIAEQNGFSRKRGRLGYIPQHESLFDKSLPGAQFQLLLPLMPRFDFERSATRTSILAMGLPTTFQVQPYHARGHVVPLADLLEQPTPCVRRSEVQKFRAKCEELCQALLWDRSPHDPLVFDFFDLHWTPGQLETFLFLMQNVVQNRPVLLVELDVHLARGTVKLERDEAPTTLGEMIDDDKVIEKKFLETYNVDNSTILGIDRDGRLYIFGLRGRDYELALLSLLDGSLTIEEICTKFRSVKESVIRGILTKANPLFEVDNGMWRLAWDRRALEAQARRVMSRHFDSVAELNKAWRRGDDRGDRDQPKRQIAETKSPRTVFYLPWLDEWRSEFLQTSRILSRGRHADEAAQRLLYRLRKGLEMRGNSLSDVKVLAGASSPAMLLASALYRWWPFTESRPAVADLGPYFMSSSESLPAITNDEGLVIVQDVLDQGEYSRRIVSSLVAQNVKVLCVIALVQFVKELSETQVTPLDYGWKPSDSDLERSGGVPKHALILVRRPSTCPPLADDEDDSGAFWVEPYALRPVRLTTLRREFSTKRDPELARRDTYLEKFDSSRDGCLITAGHYVYGHRHFVIAVDMRRALSGEIGDEISSWLADVCEGGDSMPHSWEREEGKALRGDVTAVLMPLHSRIHYLWPSVENKLAQRGRRQPMYLLEATFATGSGPAYRLPIQLRYQIEEVLRARYIEKLEDAPRVRLLIVDDAIATGQTGTTILATILREIRKAVYALKLGTIDVNPVEWIRYFVVLNQTEHSSYILWRSLSTVSVPPINLVVEEYAPFMGITVYGKNDCPTCHDRVRLSALGRACEQAGASDARLWIEDRLDELEPIAIDGSGFQPSAGVQLPKAITVIAPSGQPAQANRYSAQHVDTAIWRFYELMYLSYPPGEVLKSLEAAWSPVELEGKNAFFDRQYERYRWAVLEWCIRNWDKVTADTARERFKACASREIERYTPVSILILEGVGGLYEEPVIRDIVRISINKLADLETERDLKPERIKHEMLLEVGLQLFFMNALSVLDRVGRNHVVAKNPSFDKLLDDLDLAAQPLDETGISLLRLLHQGLKKSRRHADPGWALGMFAEALFRGRDPESDPDGTHDLLPRLINEVAKGVRTPEFLRLLEGSLHLFLATMEELQSYADLDFSASYIKVRDLSRRVLEWLRLPQQERESADRDDLRFLRDALRLDGPVCQQFNRLFQAEVREVCSYCEDRLRSIEGSEKIDFAYIIPEHLMGCRVLTHVQRLVLALTNKVIDPGRSLVMPGLYKSLIKVSRLGEGAYPRRLVFRLLTSFASFEDTRRLILAGHGDSSDRATEIFGVVFAGVLEPTIEEKEKGFRAAFEVDVPTGFVPRRAYEL